MIDVIFKRVYDNGYFVVAEFSPASPFNATYDGIGIVKHDFVLNEENLKIRIANRKRYGFSIIEEISALQSIKEYNENRQKLVKSRSVENDSANVTKCNEDNENKSLS